jgi:hypothetical protein
MEETDVKNSVNRGWDLSAAAWFYWISGGEGRTVLASIEIRSASRLAYAVVGISVGLLGVMGLYLIFENLPCLLGQQVIC